MQSRVMMMLFTMQSGMSERTASTDSMLQLTRSPAASKRHPAQPVVIREFSIAAERAQVCRARGAFPPPRSAPLRSLPNVIAREEYDPAKPNDYDAVRRAREQQRREAELEAERQERLRAEREAAAAREREQEERMRCGRAASPACSGHMQLPPLPRHVVQLAGPGGVDLDALRTARAAANQPRCVFQGDAGAGGAGDAAGGGDGRRGAASHFFCSAAAAG